MAWATVWLLVLSQTAYAQCSMTLNKVTVSGCYSVSGVSRATVSVEVGYTNPPTTGNDSLVVTLGGQTRRVRIGTYNVAYAQPGGFFSLSGPQIIVSPQVVAFEIPANSASGPVTARFNTLTACQASGTYTAPGPCPPLVCSGTSLGGIIYNDFNNDGTRQAGETNGVAAIVVKAIATNGTSYSTTTDANGLYTLTIPVANYPVRVEFGNIPSAFNEGFAGPNSGTRVQFIGAPSCTVDLGLSNPASFCQSAPPLFIPCYTSGDPLAVGGTAGPADAFIKFPYGVSGTQVGEQPVATAAQIGTTWGVAWNKNTKRVFTSAVLKRHAGLGPAGLGGIYVVDYSNPASPVTSTFLDVTTLGINVGSVPSNAARGLVGDKTQPSADSAAFALSGKVGMGDLDISEDNSTLYFTNLFDQKLYAIDITQYNLNGTLPTSANVTSFAIPASCTGGTFRPWAIKPYNGKVYVGGVCDALPSQNKSNLRASVYELNGVTFTSIFDFPLTYPKGYGNSSSLNAPGWYPWTDNFDQLRANTGGSGSVNLVYPQPIFADIEFDIDGSMVLGFGDRTGFQGGDQNLRPNPTNDTRLFSVNPQAGDILRAYAANGAFVLENNAKAGPNVGAGPNNNQGPGFGEFYADNHLSGGGFPLFDHTELALGGLALRPGSGEVVAAVFDPIDTRSYAAGIRNFNNSTGLSTVQYEVYSGRQNNGLFGKASGLGDIELGCDAITRIEIGNRVWLDTNQDGTQNPNETPLAGVNVSLYKGGVLIATTTTNAQGNYYFSTKSRLATGTWSGTGADTTLLPNTAYQVAFGTGGQFATSQLTVGGSMYQLTTANNLTAVNANDLNDSDPSVGTVAGITAPVLSLTTGNFGTTDHSFDAGFFCPKPVLAVSPASQTICQGGTIDSFTATVVSNTVTSQQWYITNATGTAFTVISGATSLTYSPAAAQQPAVGATRFYAIIGQNGAACSDTAYTSLSIRPLPTLTFTAPASATTTVCANTTLNLSVSSNAVAPDSIQFVYFDAPLTTPSDAYTATDGTVLGTVGSTSAVGTKTVTLNNVLLPDNIGTDNDTISVYALLVSPSGACRPIAQRTIILKPRPDVSITGETEICTGTTTQLFANTAAGATVQFFLNNGTTAVSTANPYTTPAISTTTTYRVRATLATCVSDEATIVLLPVVCTPCVSGTGNLGGVVYRDFNSNGVNNTEAGFGGVTVTVFRCDANGGSVQVAQVQTDIKGQYSVTGLAATTDYRVEFTNLPAGYEPTARGTQNGTTVQFTRPGSCSISLGLNQPADYCQDNPKEVTPCYIDGAVSPNTTGLTTVLVSVNYVAPSAANKTEEATRTEIGSTWGLAYAKRTKQLYSAAFLKRHVGLLNGKLGQIYVSDFSQASTPTTPWLDVSTLGIPGNWQYFTDAQRGLGNAGSPSNDPQTFSLVAAQGLGDIDITEDGSTMYVMDLTNRQLLSINVATKTLNGSFPVPSLCSAAVGTTRPFGTKVYQGKVYIGAVCDAGTSQLRSNLVGGVFVFDPATSTFNPTPVLTIPLTYLKGTNSTACFTDVSTHWNPWTNVYPSDAITACSSFDVYNQPVLSDIEFDSDGSMIVGLFDRFGHQIGAAPNHKPDGTTSGYGVVGGDILRAYFNGTSFELEDNAKEGASSPKAPTTGRNNNQGPGGGEFYVGDQINGGAGGAHFETSMGGLALKPGAGDIRLTMGDPLSFNAGGLSSLDNRTGVKIIANSINLYASFGGGTQGKSNGLGDLEILCDAAPIQIGNRVFRDINRNGIQDPCEPPIAGAVVVLYNAAKTTALASVTTNAAGEYYFGSPGSTSANSTSSVSTSALSYSTAYALQITSLGSGTAANGLTLTDVSPLTPGESGTANSGTTQINNDAMVMAGRPTIMLTTGGPGENNHTYDFGLAPCIPPSLTALASSATICQGAAVTLTAQVSPAGSYTYVVTGPAGVTLSTTTSATAIATGLAVGVNTFTITAGSSPTCFTTATVSVTVATPPGITLTSATVCAGQPVSLTASGAGAGATYVFSTTGAVGNLLTITPTVTGAYTVTATTSGGCTATATAQVTVNPLPIATLTQTATVCIGQPVTLTATGGTSYTFSTGLIANANVGLLTFTPTSTTTISVTVATASGCRSTTFATVTVNPLPVATLTPAIICAGETVTLTATGGTSYTFSTGQTNLTGLLTLTPTSTTTISVTVATASGCVSTTTATVTVNPLPTLVTSVSCVGIATYTVSFTATPGAVVTSSSGFVVGNSVVGITSGQSVTLTTTLNGCSVSTQLNQNCLSNAAGLGDFVFEDSNRDGTQDAGEPPIPNVTVILYLNGVASATTVTNASGLYSFTGLTPGSSNSYSVGFTTPANYTATGANLGGDDTKDSDAIPATGRTQSITLANGEFNPTLDAGFYRIPARLGDFVFEDRNRNGQQDAGEPGIPGVTVTLLSSGTLVNAVSTDGSGLYSFTGLTPGVPYSVSFTAPTGYSATLQDVGSDATDSDGNPATGLTGVYSLTAGENNPTVDMGYFRPASLGDFVFVDTNKNGQQDAGEPPIPGVVVTLISNGTVVASTTTNSSGLYSFTGLTPGVPYSVSFTTPANYSVTISNVGNDATDSDPVGGVTAPVTLTSGENNTTLDAGFILLTAGLGDFVFEDSNHNGQQNTGEPGIPNVSVSLLSSGTLVASTTTDVNGLYSFTGLTPGVPYSVSFTAPTGYSATLQNVGPDATDSDGDAITGLTGVYSLTANEFNPTVDMGYFRPASLGNFVFADNNRDGIQDSGDTPIPGVTVTLLDGLNTPITSTTTDVNGLYSFTGLTPGVPYSVSFTAPANYSATLSNVGNDGLDSDPVGGVTAPVTLTSGENNTSLDAGFYLVPAQLGDFVFEDSNRNGQQNTGEPGIPGVTVTLLANGSPVASTLTNGSGLYSFTGLTPGVPYSVSFTAPTGYSATVQNIGPDATDSDGNPATGLTGVYSLTAGENNPTVDMGYFRPASLGDFVFADNNQDGQQDGGDTPIPGVVVTLLDGTNTPIASTTTNSSGLYSFTGLTPGVPYSVSFTTPTGYSVTTPNVPGNDAIDSDPVGGVTAPVTLTSGENNTTLDAGFYLPCSLSAVVTAGLCSSATNTYSATAVVTVQNPAGAQTLTISNGTISQPFTTTAGSSNTFTAIFNGLTSDGASHSITVTLPGCGSATVAYTAPVACSVTPVCTIVPVVTPGLCTSATNTYSATAVVQLTNPPGGVLTVSTGGQSLTTTIASGLSNFSYTAQFSGLVSDGSSQTVTASLPGCADQSVTYTAPASCSLTPVCSISATVSAGLCSTATNTFATTATVTVTNPAAGTLTVLDGTISRTFATTAGASNTFTIINTGITSDGSAHTVTASIPGCSSATVTYTAPVSCTIAPVCSVSITASAGVCDPVTNAYLVTAVVTVQNPTGGATLSISNGTVSQPFTTTAGSSNTFTAIFAGLPSDGANHIVTTSLPGCSSATALYTAPVSCSVAPVCSVGTPVITPGVCNSATNTYSVTAVVTLQNTTAGVLTVTNGGQSLTTTVAGGLSSFIYTAVFTSQPSDGLTQTLLASLPGCGSQSATYTAPASCSVTPLCLVGTPVVTVGPCLTATNTYSATAVVTVQNPTNGGILVISNGTTSQPFTTTTGTSNTFTMVFTGLTSTGTSQSITASLPGCGSATASYTAPASCSVTPVCSVNPVVTPGLCNSATNTYSATAVVQLSNPPAGLLTVTNGASSLTTTIASGLTTFTFTATFNNLISDGSLHTVVASLPGCASATVSYTAPVSCSIAPVCSLSSVATAGVCNTATNTYSSTAVITLTNPAAGVLTVSNGPASLTFAVPTLAGTVTVSAIFNGLISDGTSQTITASLPGCSSATVAYIAPASCTVDLALSVTDPGTCQTATNGYTTSGVVSLTNAVAGIATITDGPVSATVAIAVGATSVPYALSGLTSGTGSHSVTVSYAGKMASTTYTAPISCTVLDLALTKTMLAGQSTTVTAGSSVTFAITVINQGTVPATAISLVDYIPAGLTLSDPNWTTALSGSGTTATLNTPIASLSAGASTTLTISFVVNPGIMGQLINRAEISANSGGSDIDSSPDSNPANDAGGAPNTGSDDAVMGNGTGTPGDSNAATDEDDADPVLITVVPAPVFDLALRKTLAPGQAVSVTPGSSVTFTVTVFNQGNLAATAINLVDYIPTGLTLNDPNWTLSGSTASLNTPIASLSAGASTSRTIVFTVNSGGSTVLGDLVNRSEISSATGGSDIDSSPDSNPANDAGGAPNTGSDDAVMGNGTGTPGDSNAATDEDDADPAVITVTLTPVCSINPVVTTGLCTSATNTYSVSAVITLANTTAGILTVSTQGQSLTTTVASGLTSFTYAAVFNGLISDGTSQTLTTSLPGCDTATASYSAPESCSLGLALTVTPGTCETATNGYIVTGSLSLTNASAGTATITDGAVSTTLAVALGTTSLPYSLTGLASGTGVHTITVLFAGQVASVTYTAPLSCSVAPALAVTITPGTCSTATNTFDVSGTISLTAAVASTLTISDGTSSTTVSVVVGQTSVSFSLPALISGTGSHTVTVSGLGYSPVSTTYTAPESCTVGIAITVTPGVCQSATNQYSISGTLSLTNAIVGTAILTDGTSTTTISVSAGATAVPYVLSGLTSDAASHTVSVSYAGEVASVTYTAPASCSVNPPCLLSLVITPGVCQTATNQYSVTGSVSATNAVGSQVVTITDGTASTTVSLTGNGPASFTLTGLNSDGVLHSVAASAATCGLASQTYTAPVSCTVAPARLGDFVFVDANQNGVQDAGDTPLPGVTVTLLDGTNSPIASTTTDVNGLYSFTGLTPGVPYSVSFTAPAGYSATTPLSGTNTTVDSNPIGGLTAPVTLTSGENNPTLDAGFFVPTAGLGDFAFVDVNKDGIQDGGDSPLPGVLVTLYTNGVASLTTITDGSGLYSFTGLTPGSSLSYSVGFTTPAGYTATTAHVGSNSALDSDADVLTGRTQSVTLAAGEFNPTLDAGFYIPSASLGDFVFVDTNKDGIQDGGEPGIPGVVVVLVDGTNTPITSATTNASGLYSFTGLTPGVPYSVSFVTPAGYTSTSAQVGGDDTKDSDANPVTGQTRSVTLAAGENNPNLDAGFFVPTAGLGDFVFEDSNHNGIQDAGEPGIPGVTVSLLSSTSLVATTTTNASGLYSFTGLTPSVPYSVSFTAPAGYSATLQNIGNDATDSDGNPATGLTGVYSLTAGENNPTVDMGYFRPASLGDFVFIDANQNGIQDAGEPGIPGVPVTLLSSGTVVASTTTDPSGLYSFTGLTPGVPYSVSFTTPAGYSATTSLSGTNTSVDSNPVGGVTAPVTLTSGENNPTLDAGFFIPTGSIGSVVTIDLNRNGQRDPGEPGVDGVTVRLLQETTPGNYTVVSTTLTSGGGHYLFPNLPAGTYVVEFVNIPSGYVLSPKPNQPGVPDSLDSDANPVTGRTDPVVLNPLNPAQATILTVDAGLETGCPPATCVPLVIRRTR